MKAIANYNMGFDNGTFVKGEAYNYRKADKNDDSQKFFITTEEKTEQELWDTEFDILFTIEGEE